MKMSPELAWAILPLECGRRRGVYITLQFRWYIAGTLQ
jgi:hypothetical protein